MTDLTEINQQAQKVLRYDPSIELIEGLNEITITCHGYGANKDIGAAVAQRIDTAILTFNFPDHDIDDQFDINTSLFGTIDEYRPLLFVIKTAVELGAAKINLYGYSAGGGAIINALALLNNPKHVKIREELGIDPVVLSKIKKALSEGLIILDTPLKSVTEILSIRPDELNIQIWAKRFRENGFEPINVIDQLAGLKLNILVYFEQPDEILSNRDDELYFHKLFAINGSGITRLLIGYTDGHFGPHEKLWQAVNEMI